MDDQGTCSVVLQSVSVCKMGSVFSDSFLVNNCVRQGILLPLLFNVYNINELSMSLSKLPVGCCCVNIVVNYVC